MYNLHPKNRAKYGRAQELIKTLPAREVARRLGVTDTTIRCWTDAKYNVRRRQQVNARRGCETRYD